METYTNGRDTISLRQREHNPNLWEMIRDGEWIGAADYHDLLVTKLERNGFHAVVETPEALATVEENRQDEWRLEVAGKGFTSTIYATGKEARKDARNVATKNERSVRVWANFATDPRGHYTTDPGERSYPPRSYAIFGEYPEYVKSQGMEALIP